MKTTLKMLAQLSTIAVASTLPLSAQANVQGHLNYLVTPDTREVRAGLASDRARFNFREEGEEHSAHVRLAFPKHYLGGELWLRQKHNGSDVAVSITPKDQFIFPTWLSFDDTGKLSMLGAYASGTVNLSETKVFYAGEKNWYPQTESSDDAWFVGAAQDSLVGDYRVEAALINHYSHDKREVSISVANEELGGLIDYVTTPDSWSTSLWLATKPKSTIANGPHTLGNIAPGEMAETRTHFTPTNTKGDLSAKINIGDCGEGLEGYVEAGKSLGKFGFTVGTTFDGDFRGSLTCKEGNIYAEAVFHEGAATLYGNINF